MTYSRKLTVGLLTVASAISLTACTEADRVSTNLSSEADNFNTVRKVTVINAIKNEQFSDTGQFMLKVGA